MNLVDEAIALLWYQSRNAKSEIEELCRRQQKLMSEAEQSWKRFLPWFKKQCRDFSDRADSGFEPLLQKLLLGEDWTFPQWKEVFYTEYKQERRYNYPYQDSLYDVWSIQCYRHERLGLKTDRVRSKIQILANAEEWTRNFLAQIYACYEKLPRVGTQGLFDRELTWEDLFKYIEHAVWIGGMAGGRFEPLFNLKLQIFQNFRHQVLQDSVPAARRREHNPAPDLKLKENNLLFIKNTPFELCVQRKIKLDLPLKPRYESQWNIGAQGSGKTQLLQRMICDDIEHGRSVVVMDSQRDMIMEKLLWLKHDLEVVLIDPEDIEHPPGIALFDIDFGIGGDAEGQQTHVMNLYNYMFSVLGTDLTGRQGSLFDHALALMFDVPESNIYTLIDLFRGDKYQFKRYWDRTEEREFFDKEFFEPKYKANRDQILAKLNILTSPGHKTLRRILANKKNKIDFFALLNRPVAVFVNTSQRQLGPEGCTLFGRFILALLVRALVARSIIPEDQRNPTFIYVDEGKDYGNDDAFERIIYQCRKQKAGLVFCSQNVGQLSKETVTALFTSSIKFVRAVKEPAETRKLSQALRVEDGFLDDLHAVDSEKTANGWINGYSEWACQIQNRKTVKARVDFGYLENRPKITEAEYQKLREENRRKYCVKVGEVGRRSSDDWGSSEKRRDTLPDDDDYFV